MSQLTNQTRAITLREINMSRYKVRGPYDKEVKIEVNAIECNNCRDIVFSRALHDYRTCSCGACSIDGGLDYCRLSGTNFTGPFKLKITQTKQELFDDWNKSEDRYGLIKNKKYKYWEQENTGYGRTVEMSERKRRRGGFNSNGNRPTEVAKIKLRKGGNNV